MQTPCHTHGQGSFTSHILLLAHPRCLHMKIRRPDKHFSQIRTCRRMRVFSHNATFASSANTQTCARKMATQHRCVTAKTGVVAIKNLWVTQEPDQNPGLMMIQLIFSIPCAIPILPYTLILRLSLTSFLLNAEPLLLTRTSQSSSQYDRHEARGRRNTRSSQVQQNFDCEKVNSHEHQR